MTGWQFACDWYDVDEIHACLIGKNPCECLSDIPTDHTSREFAEWLAHEYRLAMHKGIQIGLGWEQRFGKGGE